MRKLIQSPLFSEGESFLGRGEQATSFGTLLTLKTAPTQRLNLFIYNIPPSAGHILVRLMVLNISKTKQESVHEGVEWKYATKARVIFQRVINHN